MSVVSVTEKPEGRSASTDLQLQRSYSRVFQVRTDSATDGAATARDAVGVPAIGAIHPEDARAFCSGKSANAAEDRVTWAVTCQYTTRPQTKCADEISDNPLDDPPDISIGLSRYQEVVNQDRDGDPINNSAREQFNPLPERDASRLVITIVRNEEELNPQQILDYQDAINSDDWQGFEAGQLKINITPDRQVYTSGDTCIVYWRKTYTIEVRDTWDVKRLDEGFCKLVADKQERIKVGDKAAEYPANPVLLDGSGAVLADGGNPVFLTFEIYENEQQFEDLDLPDIE